MRKIFCLVFYAALAMPGTSWSNSAPIWHPGTNATDVIPIKNHHIRMIKETVDIDCHWTSYTVHVKFWYKNTADQEQELDMGFPIVRYGNEEPSSLLKNSLYI